MPSLIHSWRRVFASGLVRKESSRTCVRIVATFAREGLDAETLVRAAAGIREVQ